MKTIGLIGGMSWESSLEYYRLLNQLVREQRGGQNNAKSVLYTVNFHEIEQMQHEGRWDDAAAVLAEAAVALEQAGADVILLCTNTMHKVAPAIQAAIKIPFLHIATATAERIHATGIRTTGLLGTAYTMEQDFYKGILTRDYGMTVLIPDDSERQEVHRIIYDELCQGHISPTSRTRYRAIMQNLVAHGAEGIILGCTEITLLVNADDATVPLFDTTRIHAETAVAFALQ